MRPRHGVRVPQLSFHERPALQKFPFGILITVIFWQIFLRERCFSYCLAAAMIMAGAGEEMEL